MSRSERLRDDRDAGEGGDSPAYGERSTICRCADPGPETESHCALLRDFPGGFYGDDDAAEYQSDESLWCDCECHRAIEEVETDEDDELAGLLEDDGGLDYDDDECA